MRLLLYNIRYGTGGRNFLLNVPGYLSFTSKNLARIANFIHSLNPDIVGLIEVDAGSYRSARKNQAEVIAEKLGHYHLYKSKYVKTVITGMLPLMSKQGNAFLARDSIKNEKFHYFSKGVKRLVIELELDNLVVFLVHLSLTFKTRHVQLGSLYSLVKNTKKPHIVVGDFNVWLGDREIDLFVAATGLRNANIEGLPTYPSAHPSRQLDFILYKPGNKN